MNKVFQLKILLGTLHHHFHKKVKVEVFTKYYLSNIGRNREFKHNKKKWDVTAKDQSV